MNNDLEVKLVLASVLVGLSSMANAMPVPDVHADTKLVPARQEIVVSDAAPNVLDAKFQVPGTPSEGFLQICKPGGSCFGESGPEFSQSWNGQMRLPRPM